MKRRLKRQIGVLLLCIALVLVVVAWRFMSSRHVPPWQHLALVVQLESVGIDKRTVQSLGSSLAILGRDDEVRKMDFFPQLELPPLTIKPNDLRLNMVPWREGIQDIAEGNRIVMIMENHLVSKHREMIGATLPIFRSAEFTHFAAEGIGESSSSLSSRGFPTFRSGFYTSDPQFGNVLRRGLDLGFTITGYDFRPFSHEMRENYAANELAKLLHGNSTKILVHAGPGHVLKHETENGQRWLAALLWERTGIEPFTIWQWSSLHDNHEYRVVAAAIEELGDFNEPILLRPPPGRETGLRDVPDVDAILVHPRDHSVAPDKRTVLFPYGMKSISGQWNANQWPVVIAAYKKDEPIAAIPLDQIMLRDEERDFMLWVPTSTKCDIVVFGPDGILDLRNQIRIEP